MAERGYGYPYQKARAAFLSKPENEWCHACGQRRATQVHHINRDAASGVIDTTTWEPLCLACHNKISGQDSPIGQRGGAR